MAGVTSYRFEDCEPVQVPPVLAVLQKMEVITVRLRYPGQLIAVEVDVSMCT